MMSAFFYFQSTINRLLNDYKKLYYYGISSSQNMKGQWTPFFLEKTNLKKPTLFRFVKSNILLQMDL